MLEFIIEESSLTYRWTYDRMLPWVPGPGTPAFVTLCREWHPYGISPAGILLDVPSGKLSEASLGVALLQGRVGVRVTYGWTEVYVKELLDEDEAALFNIAEGLFNVLGEIDAEVTKGRAEVTYNAHLSLPASELDGFIRRHLSGAVGENVMPDAFAYKITADDQHGVPESRLVLARSIRYQNALFIEFVITYTINEGPIETGRRFAKDLYATLGLFDLTERAEQSDL